MYSCTRKGSSAESSNNYGLCQHVAVTIVCPINSKQCHGRQCLGTKSGRARLGVPGSPGSLGVPGVPGSLGVPGVPGSLGSLGRLRLLVLFGGVWRPWMVLFCLFWVRSGFKVASKLL